MATSAKQIARILACAKFKPAEHRILCDVGNPSYYMHRAIMLIKEAAALEAWSDHYGQNLIAAIQHLVLALASNDGPTHPRPEGEPGSSDPGIYHCSTS